MSCDEKKNERVRRTNSKEVNGKKKKYIITKNLMSYEGDGRCTGWMLRCAAWDTYKEEEREGLEKEEKI